MNETREGMKSFWHGVGSYRTLCVFASFMLVAYLYEPFPVALNAYLIERDLVPLILLFDSIGTLLCFFISGILLFSNAYSLAWLPFALGTVFVLPKLAALHLGLVENPLWHFLSAYSILIIVAPATYFGWRISRAAIKNRGKDTNPAGNNV